MRSFFHFVAASVLSSQVAIFPAPEQPGTGTEVMARFLKAAKIRQDSLRGTETEVEISAALPHLERTGSLRALRRELCDGVVDYRALSYSGDPVVKREIIARYLNAEARTRSDATLAINPDNYSFRAKAVIRDGKQIQVVRLRPRKRRAGLFQGEIWIDDESGMPLREAGQFVNLRSVVVRRIRFVREYELRDGLATPTYVDSTIETRIAGHARLQVRFFNLAVSQRCRTPELAAPSPAAGSYGVASQ